jgi:hypothetical protein
MSGEGVMAFSELFGHRASGIGHRASGIGHIAEIGHLAAAGAQ